jgi:CheY-like chemotaxis protein
LSAAIRILFIDDCADDVFLAEESLRRTGMIPVTRTVQDEAALRQMLADWLPDIVVSDFAMPAFDGRHAFEVVRELAPQTPFLFRSGGVQGRLATQAISEGAAGYVEKGDDNSFVDLVALALKLDGQ